MFLVLVFGRLDSGGKWCRERDTVLGGTAALHVGVACWTQAYD